MIGFMLSPTGQASVPRIMRWLAVKDKSAVRAHFDRLAATPELKRIIVSHGGVVTSGAAETLRAAGAAI